ncbi:MAG: alpha/beta hydrolase [Desulfobacteraceae bacterium]
MLKIVLLLLGAFFVFLYLFQGKMIFYPQKVSPVSREKFKEFHYEIQTGEVVLKGWFVNRGASKQRPMIIYFGGNAEEVSGNLADIDRIHTDSFLFMNYRGYGESQGKPNEENLLRDGLVIFDHMVNIEKIPGEHIVLMGRSLGTGVACHVAARRDPAAVILVTPFDSLVNVAKKHYPIFPVNWLMRHRFESIRLAPDLQQPMLAITGTRDEIIPRHCAENLIEQWAGPVTAVSIENAGHNDISMHDAYWTALETFLQRLKEPSPQGSP